MRKLKHMAMCAALLAGASMTASALADSNVAFNKTVTLNGVYGTGGWGGGILAAGSTLTDGIYFPDTAQWDQHSVWWDMNQQGAGSNSIDIDLGGMYDIHSLSIQADNNDLYHIAYNNHGVWTAAWDISFDPSYGLIRKDSGTLPVTLTTDKLRVTASGGDSLFAVSEVQANGVPAVPEPEAAAMLLAGLGLLGLARRVTSRR